MKIFRNVLLLLCLLAICKSDPTRIHMKFRCDPRIFMWCGNLIVYEQNDSYRLDIMTNETFCKTGGTKEFNYEISKGGDKFPKYRWWYQLSHDCSSTLGTRCLSPRGTYDTPVEGLGRVEIDEDVFNRGYTGGPCLVPSEPRTMISMNGSISDEEVIFKR